MPVFILHLPDHYIYPVMEHLNIEKEAAIANSLSLFQLSVFLSSVFAAKTELITPATIRKYLNKNN